MSELPLGWVSVPLDAVSNLIRGVTYKKDESADHSEEGYLPVLRANNIQDGKLQFDDLVFVLEHNIKDIQKVKKGDIVVAMSSGSKRLVGKSGIAETDFNGGFGAFCGVLRPNQHLNSKYVGLYTLTKEYSDLVSSLSKGVNINNLKPDHFSEINIPIAPLNEQIRIANKLDSVLAKVDAAQTRLEKIPTLLKRFRQSVLAAATSGELTREWREANSTLSFGHEDELAIKEIVDAQHAADCKKAEKLGRRKPRHPRANKKSIGVEIAMPEIPEQWLYQRLEDITHLVSDGTHFTPKYVEEGIPFFSVKNVRPFKVSDEDIKYVSQEEYEEIDARCSSEFGDILYTKVGATYGYAAMNKLNYRHAIYVSLALIKPVKEYFLSEYAEIVMNSELVFGQARSRVSGMGVPDLHLIEIRDFKIPIPHVLEQKEIVRRVESLFALADVVEKQYLAAKQRLDRLTQSLLAKAFRGELVPQDPNDEPAAELLKRIQAERLAQPPVKNKRAKSA